MSRDVRYEDVGRVECERDSARWTCEMKDVDGDEIETVTSDEFNIHNSPNVGSHRTGKIRGDLGDHMSTGVCVRRDVNGLIALVCDADE